MRALRWWWLTHVWYRPAYKDGRWRGSKGYPRVDNPFYAGHPAFYAWDAGWHDGAGWP